MTKLKQTLLLTLAVCGLFTVGVLFFPFSGVSQGSGYNAFRQYISNVVAPDAGLQQNSLIKYHQLLWTVTGSPAACTVALDSSADGVSWSAGGIIAGQTCTSSGNSAITGTAQANFVRINLTTFSGGSSPTITVNYEGWAYNPVGAGGTIAAGVATEMALYTGTTTIGADPALTSNSAGTLTLGAVGVGTGGINYLGTTSGSSGNIGCNNATCTQFGGAINANFSKYVTSGNCGANGTAANPSVVTCTAAASGSFSCATNASAGTCTINTTGVTANSVIQVTQVTDESTRLGVTCNATALTLAAPLISAKVAGTSFTLTLPSFTTNPVCFDYLIFN